ncbi:acyl-CoA N-acyltransferase [Xylaria intraflava]|nr:acyl-CoA N-acyltransferase [Xylaria intraflava]
MVTVNGTGTEALSTPITPQELSKPEPVASDIQIGYAVASDAAAIAKIGADTFTATFGYAVPPDDLARFLESTYSETAIQANLNDPSLRTWAARDATGKVLAFVQLGRGRSRPCLPGDAAEHAELGRLYVNTAVHGRGIGSRLIDAVEAEARAEGFKQLWLSVWEHNPRAEKLYLKRGYKRVGTTVFPTGETAHLDFVLSKSL